MSTTMDRSDRPDRPDRPDVPQDGSARRPERLTPDQVARWEFPRSGMAKRGIDEEAVHRFQRRILNDMQISSQIEADLRTRINDLTTQLRASYSAADAASGPNAPYGTPGTSSGQSGTGGAGAGTSGPNPGNGTVDFFGNPITGSGASGASSGASPFAPPQPQVTAAAVNAISAAQRQAEEQIRAAEEYVRNVTEYARNQYQATVNEGHRQGLLAAETAFQRRSEALSANLAHLESQLEFLKAFGMAFGVQVEASLEKAREEVHAMIGTIKTAFDALKQPAPTSPAAVTSQQHHQPAQQVIGG